MTQVSVFVAIQSKYVKPTNFRGARVKASAEGKGSVVLGWDHGLNVDGNHAAAAEALREKMGWIGTGYGEMVGAQNPNGDYSWIMLGTLKEVK